MGPPPVVEYTFHKFTYTQPLYIHVQHCCYKFIIYLVHILRDNYSENFVDIFWYNCKNLIFVYWKLTDSLVTRDEHEKTIQIDMNMSTCTQTRIRTCTLAYTHTRIYTHMRSYTHRHTPMCIHTHTHEYTYTHTHKAFSLYTKGKMFKILKCVRSVVL